MKEQGGYAETVYNAAWVTAGVQYVVLITILEEEYDCIRESAEEVYQDAAWAGGSEIRKIGEAGVVLLRVAKVKADLIEVYKIMKGINMVDKKALFPLVE
eukprot:g18380.t1